MDKMILRCAFAYGIVTTVVVFMGVENSFIFSCVGGALIGIGSNGWD